MLGLMQQMPLNISALIVHAETHHGDTEIVSRRVEGDIHRTNWTGIARRARQVAHGLDALGLNAGDRVATLAWNGFRHFEIYYAVAGSGAVVMLMMNGVESMNGVPPPAQNDPPWKKAHSYSVGVRLTLASKGESA